MSVLEHIIVVANDQLMWVHVGVGFSSITLYLARY
jgi:hypothetical protein